MSRWWHALRCALLLAVIVAAVGTVTFGKHQASFNDLRAQLRHHAISHLQVEGALPAGASGYGLVRIEWREDGVTRFAEIEQASSQAEMDQSRSNGDASSLTGRIVGDLDALLHRDDPEVQITHHKVVSGLSGSVVLGWQIPGTLALPTAFIWALTIGLLVNGPEPRFATRWAWGWGLLSPLTLLVIPLYLLTAAPWRDAPKTPPGKRLTGGWAFVLLVICAGGIASRLLS